MAEDAASELARNILRNIVPLDTNNALVRGAQGVQDTGMSILQKLGLVQPPPPPLNAPLPRINPQTGQVEFPQGYQGPR
jgi:hypothetical protein